jgi:carbamoyl-phosphate synthase small subunit
MTGYLILETGECFSGTWHGGESRAAEVVFNTSHSGYEEIASDPSYFKQIVVLTAPMQGNYKFDKSRWESGRIWIDGFISLQIQNSKIDSAWLNQLIENQVPVVSEIDTRKITLRLRSGGTPWGALVKADSESAARSLATELIQKRKNESKDWVWQVSTKTVQTIKGKNPNGPKMAVIDFGTKQNIIRELVLRCSQISVFPSRVSVSEIEQFKPNGIMLTNGPGDPSEVKQSVDTVKHFIGTVPIFGICMGHQILSLALGAETYKLKFGHRGANHPIDDRLLNKVYVTSQNHGYAVKEGSLPKDVQITHVNLNDQTVAGIFSRSKKCLGIQFHPESHPGPHDAVELFDFFIDKMLR